MKNIKKRFNKLAYDEKKWEVEKELIEREQALKKEKRKTWLSCLPKISTTKKLIWFLFLNCTLVELLVGYVTLKNIQMALEIGMMPDYSPLTALVGVVVGEVIAFGVYAAKSAKENTKNGITYEMAMLKETEECAAGGLGDDTKAVG